MIRKPELFSLSSRHRKSSDFHGCDEIEEGELFLLEKVTAGGILLLIQNKESSYC